jgi:hypothetical protein
MKRITQYQTSDGKVFTDKGEAGLHEATIAFMKAMKTEYAPTFTAAPECSRLLACLAAEPNVAMAFLEQLQKAYRKMERKTQPAPEKPTVAPSLAA